MPDPNCPNCGGTGWKIVERAGLSGAEQCDCAGVASTRTGCWKAPASRRIMSARRSTISCCRRTIRLREPGLGMVLRQAMGFARDFPAVTPPGLLLIGEPGTGKTHLAVGVMKALLEKGHECVFFDYQNLLDRIRSGYDAASGTSDREAYATALECRRSAARRSGRASRHGVGGGYRDIDHHVPLQQREAADRDHQPSRSGHHRKNRRLYRRQRSRGVQEDACRKRSARERGRACSKCAR